MKNHILFILVILVSVGSASATTTDQPQGDQAQQQNQPVSGYGQQNSNRVSCVDRLDMRRNEWTAAMTQANGVQAATPQAREAAQSAILNPAFQNLNASAIQTCRAYELAAAANGEGFSEESETAVSQARRIVCVRRGTHVVDWKSCKAGKDAYDMVLIADAALNMTQQVRTAQSTNKMNNQMAQEIEAGNAQNAAYDATVQHNQHLANMNKEKVAAYTAALGLLGSKIAAWQGKSEGSLNRLCQNVNQQNVSPLVTTVTEAKTASTGSTVRPLPASKTCFDYLNSVKGSLYANDSGKAALVAAFMEYMAKAVQAGMNAKNLSNIAKQVENMKNGTEDLGPTMFERCAVAPNDPACQQAGPRIPGQEYTGGDFSIGENFNNSFGDPLQESANVEFETDDLTPDGAVASAGNPFADQAQEASGILDPAPAANFQPGSTPGGGGGGAGGGLGGGGASLGNDLNGPEAEKTAEVDAEKSSGNYNFAGGGGFQAIKPGKEDANPFASLFDSKSQGGVGEDRSFASDDIGGKDSGLFLRISRRYGKISGEKRIEAANLE